ncbi:hypothetical protein BS78_01G161100 [Paspalum vaginatum]|nr:hypothetical protein BS78_01G161100 [Paspalum vaginatum]KAJ1294644.1 hypothetical protein BS78_01G161100 [Paspalum vaginatum]KAJ1294645.1 hypothetical protein BS78_01G161100 [Paspalum vaginatum]KAJ1294646.1 hypothetical protein BS78_01G161100 [Paspalum vaginatum]
MSKVNLTQAAKDPPPMVNKEFTASDEDGSNKGGHDAKLAEGDEVKMAEAKTEAGSTEGEENGKKEYKAVKTEDACQKQGKEGENEDSRDAKEAEAAGMKMVKVKIDARNAEVQGNKKKEEMKSKTEEKENDTNAEDNVKTVDKEDACQKEDKDGINKDSHDARVAEGDEIKMIEAKTMAGSAEGEENGKKEEKAIKTEDACQKLDKEGKNEDSRGPKEAEVDGMKMVEEKVDARNAEAQRNRKTEEMKAKTEEKDNDTNIEDHVRTVSKEDACQKEDEEGSNKDSHDAKVAEGDEIKMVEAKTEAGSAQGEENGKKEEKAINTEEKKNNAIIDTKELKVLDKEGACQKEDNKVDNEDNQDAKAPNGEDMKILEGKADAKTGKKGEMEDKAEEKENGANIESKNVMMVENENACPSEDNVGKNDDSQDAKVAEGQNIETVEAKGETGNVEVEENGMEEKEKQNGEKVNGVTFQVDDMKIIDNEDGCQKEDKERKIEDNHGPKSGEGEVLMMVEAKSVAVQVEENGNKEEDENEIEERQNDNKEESICMEQRNGDKMEPIVVDKQEMYNIEQTSMEKQDGLKVEDKCCVDKHDVNDREESVEGSQEELQKEAKGNADKQEVYDREHNVDEKLEGLEEEEIIDSSKHAIAKNDQNRTAEKQEGEEQDRKIPTDGKKEDEQDDKFTVEEKDKTKDRKVIAEKEEREEVNKNVAFEKNEEVVIEMEVSEIDEDIEMNRKTTADKQEGKKDGQADDMCKQEGKKKGTERSNDNMEESGNGSVSKKEMDGDVIVEQVGESDKNMEDSKNEACKSKKARAVREKDHENDKKQDDSKSRKAKELMNTPSPYSLDRPTRERKAVKRMVEEIEEPGRSFIVEKGRGIPLKNIPSVSYRISRKKPADLKFLHQILFGRFGKAVEFKSHILEFSGFVWHESDEKHRVKAKEKLDKCSNDTLFDLCYLLAIPVSRVITSRKEDIVAKLLDFIAEPHAKDESTVSDDQGSNSRKRKQEQGSATKNPEGTHKRSRKKKLDDEYTSHKRKQRYSESESDEADAEEKQEDDHIKSDSNENKDDRYGPKRSVEGKGSTAKRMALTGSVPETPPVATLSKCSGRVSSSSRSSKDKRSAEDSNLSSRKSKSLTPNGTANSGKETNEGRSSGKGLTTTKGKSAEAKKALPSKGELQKAIARILQKVNFNEVTFSDIHKMLGDHYKADLSSMKQSIKSMVNKQLNKLAETDRITGK